MIFGHVKKYLQDGISLYSGLIDVLNPQPIVFLLIFGVKFKRSHGGWWEEGSLK